MAPYNAALASDLRLVAELHALAMYIDVFIYRTGGGPSSVFKSSQARAIPHGHLPGYDGRAVAEVSHRRMRNTAAAHQEAISLMGWITA